LLFGYKEHLILPVSTGIEILIVDTVAYLFIQKDIDPTFAAGEG
jgi:hypothetical protein